MTLWWVLAAALAFTAPHAHAVEPDEMLSDPALEARAREVSKGLRCLVCQNQSIDDSDAELARDLRVLVRERLAAGDSDAAVVDYVVSRYGDFVLLKPPLNWGTIALWAAPAALFATALFAAFLYYRRQRDVPAVVPPPLSAAEQRRLDAALRDRPQ
ncbi:MAG: cytochrome c-type biogenesis protein CcmH [Rhodospirillales bacterium]|nr:cytochrome c-type biogenesis protein CcmH [Rhodospirillales bacterium]